MRKNGASVLDADLVAFRVGHHDQIIGVVKHARPEASMPVSNISQDWSTVIAGLPVAYDEAVDQVTSVIGSTMLIR